MAVLSRPSVAVAVLAVLAVGGLAGIASPGSSATAAACSANAQFRDASCGPPPGCLSDRFFVDVPNQGPSCPATNHLWWVKLPTGDYVQTHGPDNMVPANTPPAATNSGEKVYATANGGNGGGSYEAPDTPAFAGHVFEGQYEYADSHPNVYCVSATDYRQVMLYVVPRDMDSLGDNKGVDLKTGIDMWMHGKDAAWQKHYREVLQKEIKKQVDEINMWLFESSMVYGRNETYRFQCDTDGTPSVFHVVISGTENKKASWPSIVADLKKAGFKDPKAKYWVYYATHPGTVGPNVAGQGSACPDDLLIITNCSNTGPSYAINYAYNKTNAGFFGEVMVTMHESGHTLGAVQDSAPEASLNAHCNDGWDIMCYQDGGANQCQNTDFQCGTTCVTFDDAGYAKYPYDCGGNDYFHPAPASGNYLYDHWNIGNQLDRFLHIGRPTQCADGVDNNGNAVYDATDIGCADARDDDETFSCASDPTGFLIGGPLCMSDVTTVNGDPCSGHAPFNVNGAIGSAWAGACNAPNVKGPGKSPSL